MIEQLSRINSRCKDIYFFLIIVLFAIYFYRKIVLYAYFGLRSTFYDYFKVIHKTYFGVGGAKKVFSLFWAILWSKLEKL